MEREMTAEDAAVVAAFRSQLNATYGMGKCVFCGFGGLVNVGDERRRMTCGPCREEAARKAHPCNG